MGAIKKVGEGLAVLRAIVQSDAVNDVRERLLEHATRLAESEGLPRVVSGSAGIVASLLTRPATTRWEVSIDEGEVRDEELRVTEPDINTAEPPQSEVEETPIPEVEAPVSEVDEVSALDAEGTNARAADTSVKSGKPRAAKKSPARRAVKAPRKPLSKQPPPETTPRRSRKAAAKSTRPSAEPTIKKKGERKKSQDDEGKKG